MFTGNKWHENGDVLIPEIVMNLLTFLSFWENVLFYYEKFQSG